MAKSIPSRKRETVMLEMVKNVRRLFLSEFLKANGMYFHIEATVSFCPVVNVLKLLRQREQVN